ncbi:MAG: ImmA/IrrE family metallo-endopeptidase [Kiritimatiellae bacterium]|nr:ImmA/IrrE family metallo-endopeptidase [Kiritimatiellia bacterium]
MSAIQPILLRLVRESFGESQETFAKRFNLKQAVWSKYENGGAEPTEKTLGELCEQTGYNRDFFFQPAAALPGGLVFHRKRSSLSAFDRDRIEAEARLRAVDAAALCRKRKVRSNVPAEPGPTPEETARVVRALWKCGDGPIDDLVNILDNNGIVILEFNFGTGLLDGFFLRLPDDGLVCIALNSDPSIPADRRHFTLAHELGHALLHREAFPGKEAEIQADRFAAELLLPESSAKPELSSKYAFWELKELKARWKVSIAAILHRSKEFGLLSESRYRSYFVYLNKIGCRKKEPSCNVVRRESRLIPHLLRRCFPSGNPADAAGFLRLSVSRFLDRYPAYATA